MKINEATFAITTQDLAPTGNAPTAGSFAQWPYDANAVDTFLPYFDSDVSYVGLAVHGTYTGLLNIMGTIDGLKWDVLGDYLITNRLTGLAQQNITSGQTGLFVINVAGLAAIRVDAPNAVTGEADVQFFTYNGQVAPPAPMNPMSTGAQSISLAASGADQVASATPGRCVRVVVLTAGSAATSIYDNATAGSGKLICVLPATPTVGAIYELQLPVTAGITVKGAANTSGVLVVYN